MRVNLPSDTRESDSKPASQRCCRAKRRGEGAATATSLCLLGAFRKLSRGWFVSLIGVLLLGGSTRSAVAQLDTVRPEIYSIFEESDGSHTRSLFGIESITRSGTVTLADYHESLTQQPVSKVAASSSAQISESNDLVAEEHSTAYQDSNRTSAFAPRVEYNPCVPEQEEDPAGHLIESFLEALSIPGGKLSHCLGELLHMEHDEPHTELTQYAIGLQPVPCRPPLVVELGEEFLGPGRLEQGICLPTGEIVRPALWVWGTFSTGVNYFDNGSPNGPVVEWANRLDLFTQLNLSGTERVVLGLRPFDKELATSRRFGSYDFQNDQSIEGINDDIQTLFFEGDIGEMFPTLDWYDTKSLDIGFSVGRQPLSFQQGLLVNEDMIDALTVTRNTLYGNGNLNLRSTFVYAWDRMNRTQRDFGTPGTTVNLIDTESQMIGLFTESDFEKNMVNADVAYVWSDDGIHDLVAMGVSGVRRFHGHHNTYNSSLHFLASFPTNGETVIAGQGELLFSQFSFTPHHTNDLVYVNGFWAIDQFTSASRGPLQGGPLGQTGLLFAAAGLGRYGAPLSNTADNVVGASLGYQAFFDHTRQQVVFEVGARQDTDQVDQAAVAAGMRYQKALDQHWVFILDGFVAKREDRNVSQGVRTQMLLKF